MNRNIIRCAQSIACLLLLALAAHICVIAFETKRKKGLADCELQAASPCFVCKA